LILEKEATFHVFCGDKPLTFEYDIDPNIPDMMNGDALRLNQIIINLLGNAVKFTSSGKIKLTIELVHISAAELMLQFCMEDSGIGIDAAHLESIFDYFNQADNSITRKYGGTGLGLSISRALVEKMGGRIWVQSEPGKGSRFYFTAVFGTETLKN
jgi:osomolarity two-component system sensor histidine kinase NIK1